MDAIKDIIPRVISPLSKGELTSADIARQWQGINPFPGKASAAAFKNGVLTVHVDCGARAAKLNMLKEELMDSFKEKCPGIKGMRFVVGKLTT